MVEILFQTGCAVFAQLFGEVAFCRHNHGVVSLEGFQRLFHTVDKSEFMEGKVGDYLLDAVIYLFRESTSAKFQGGICHAYHICLRTVAEQRDVFLLLVPEHLLNSYLRGVVGKEFCKLGLGIPEELFVLPEGVVGIKEYMGESAFQVHDLFCGGGVV